MPNSELEYFKQEGLSKYIGLESYGLKEDKIYNENDLSIPPDLYDLVNLHRLIRKRKCFTVLEFGIGFSTYIIADALMKNKLDFEKLDKDKIPKIRNNFMFKSFVVDASKYWLEKVKSEIPHELKEYLVFKDSSVHVGTFNGQLCHYYDNLPNIVPDFIYLDAPSPKDVQGSINGLDFSVDERTVMAGDLLLMEPTFLPGTMILVDGRTNNVRFLLNNFKRKYEVNWDRKYDFTTIELVEERLGKLNVIGKDFY